MNSSCLTQQYMFPSYWKCKHMSYVRHRSDTEFHNGVRSGDHARRQMRRHAGLCCSAAAGGAGGSPLLRSDPRRANGYCQPRRRTARTAGAFQQRTGQEWRTRISRLIQFNPRNVKNTATLFKYHVRLDGDIPFHLGMEKLEGGNVFT